MHKVLQYDYPKGEIQWFVGGKLNVTVNCLDRHLAKRADQIAVIWEGDDPADSRTLTYRELHEQVCKFGNVLKAQGVEKRRPGLHLSADDRRSGGSDSGLCADRRGAFHRLRRLFGRCVARSDNRRRLPLIDLR
ncbi:AMP-binding protein [Methylomonas koyamae]|uniref:AMP-binding protein n=1 Tax=Methylomonas koyamae TaxID=702114 RepID=UPI0035712FB7